ncbi:MAG: hypothetical protein NUV93_09165 [Firmicutes bacterium]|jgi:hypothetical protein|nr:hypothetical protein [Bacillota bacterium]
MARLRHDWARIKSEYVEGARDEAGNVIWPTVEELARKHGISVFYAQRKAADEGWSKERQIYLKKIEEARREKKSEALASEAAQFDAEVLRVARAGVAQVTAHLAQGARQYKETQEPMHSGELDRLSRALERFQKAGKLALGESVEGEQEIIVKWADDS